MNRTIRTILGAVLILVITFAAISICQNIGTNIKADVTEQKIFTLSDGTKAILGRINQPIQAKLYYAKTAAMKTQDSIKFFNNYYEFVKTLLQEYVNVSHGMIKLEVIDPRPYTTEEEDALRYGLKRFPINDEENFFFGLVIQTPFGVEKTIPFFSPDRQNFVEYDISYLIDNAITREKKRVGIMSSLPIMGDNVSDYMAQMMQMQGQQPKQPWAIVTQLKSQFTVESIPTDINDVNDINNVDVLLVVHPKDLPEKTQFAIDQYVLNGGRTILCVDPYCYADRPKQPQMQMQGQQDQSSNLEALLHAWGLEMPKDTFAGDLNLAIAASVSRNQRPEKIIGYLGLEEGCFNKDQVISAELNQVRMLFAGALKELPQKTQDPNHPTPAEDITRTPLIYTTSEGNTFKVSSPFELQYNLAGLRDKFSPGTKPVDMGYFVTGKLPSAFPQGIDVDVKEPDPNDPNETVTVKHHLTGLAQAEKDCDVVVFSDVDFLSNDMAYSQSIFGSIVNGDNAALLINSIENLCGSNDLISIRSRGNFRRPFTVVDEIEKQAEAETAQEVDKLNLQISAYNQELQKLVNSAQNAGNQDVIGSTIVQKRRDLELKIRDAKRQLNEVKLKRRERIEALGNELRQFNMLAAPIVILVIAIILGIRRSVRKRYYISRANV